MTPLAARAPRTRLAAAWTVAGLALAVPLVAIGVWIAALAGQYETRAGRVAELRALEARLIEARAEAGAQPHLALIADPDVRASLRSLSAAEARLTAQASALAGRLEAAGLQPVLSSEITRTTLGGIDEVRMSLSARDAPDTILQALAAGVMPDLRVFSLRIEPLEGGQADLTLMLVRPASPGGADAD